MAGAAKAAIDGLWSKGVFGYCPCPASTYLRTDGGYPIECIECGNKMDDLDTHYTKFTHDKVAQEAKAIQEAEDAKAAEEAAKRAAESAKTKVKTAHDAVNKLFNDYVIVNYMHNGKPFDDIASEIGDMMNGDCALLYAKIYDPLDRTERIDMNASVRKTDKDPVAMAQVLQDIMAKGSSAS